MAMTVNLENRINNTTLSRSNTLLPLFEAIVNSFQAIQDAGCIDDGRIHVQALRQLTLALEGEDPRRAPITSFTVEDNGIGFTEANYRSFHESDSAYKKERGGKGIGRFLWLKAFDHVQIESTYAENGWKYREFVFRKRDASDSTPATDSCDRERFTRVSLRDVREEYAPALPRSLEHIAQRIVEHCIPLFMSAVCPQMSITDGIDSIDLNAFFDKYSRDRLETREFEVKGNKFDLVGLRLVEPKDRRHSLVFSAHAREVVTRPLSGYLKSLKAKLHDDEGKEYAYLGYIKGPYLDTSVSPNREGFTFPEKRIDDNSLSVELSLQDIAEQAVRQIEKDLAEPMEELDKAKAVQIETFVDVNPRYRVLWSDREALLREIPPGLSDRELAVEMEERHHRKTMEVRKEVEAALELRPDGLDPAEYQEELRKVIALENDLGKSLLADYVAHRKVIIEFLRKALKMDVSTGKYCLEEAVHNLIFSMHTTSDDIEFEDHNLWLIDERLSYHVCLTSDKQLRSTPHLDSDSKLRPDLLLFNKALAFNEGGPPVTSFTVIEFKRPERDAFNDKGLLQQVYELTEKLRTNHFKGDDGREVMLASPEIPAYIYVICDLTENAEKECRIAGLHKTPDKLGYFGYNDNYFAYVEVISYNKLLMDAEKRNKVLFDKLRIGHIRLT